MRFLEGIEWTLRTRGTAMQRVLCAAMMAALTGARLPGGGYACQLAMFAVLLRRGLLVPAAFAGMMTGFVVSRNHSRAISRSLSVIGQVRAG